MLNLYLDKPIFSLVVFCSGKGNDTEKCLESLLAQTFPDFEVVCVAANMGMPREKISRLAARDPRVSILLHNGGNPFNDGLAQARGEYVLFLDGDDLCEPDLLELVYAEILKEYGDIIIFNHAVQDKNSKGDKLLVEQPENEGLFNTRQASFENRKFSELESVNFQHMACKKQFIYEHRLFHQEMFSFDRFFFGMIAFFSAAQISFIDKILVRPQKQNADNNSNGAFSEAAAFVKMSYFIKHFIAEDSFYEKSLDEFISFTETKIDDRKNKFKFDEQENIDILIKNYKILTFQN